MTGTSAALTNTMGKMPVNMAAWTPSTCLIASATTAEIHEKTNPTESTSAIIPIAPTTPFWNLNPTRYATTITRSSRIRFLATSEVVRPTRTAERAIGSERNRSTRPFFMSSARPIAVVVEPKIAFCTKMPGIRNITYVKPGGRFAMFRANTIVNSRTNMIGCANSKTRAVGMRRICSRFRRITTMPSATPYRTRVERSTAADGSVATLIVGPPHAPGRDASWPPHPDPLPARRRGR